MCLPFLSPPVMATYTRHVCVCVPTDRAMSFQNALADFHIAPRQLRVLLVACAASMSLCFGASVVICIVVVWVFLFLRGVAGGGGGGGGAHNFPMTCMCHLKYVHFPMTSMCHLKCVYFSSRLQLGQSIYAVWGDIVALACPQAHNPLGCPCVT